MVGSLGRTLSAPILWIGLGLLFLVAGLQSDAPRSPFWPVEWLLYALFLGALALKGRIALVAGRTAAPVAYLALSWLFGMIYEASLTVDGSGIGGMHPDTRTSFVLAQGDYVLIALCCWLAVRWLRLDFRRAFFLAGGFSLTEGLIVTGVLAGVIASPHAIWAPVVFAYYMLVYACFIALPLLFVRPQALWHLPEPGRLSALLCVPLGFVIALPIRIVWGLVYGPAATALFGLEAPANG
jgi:hypothetical protein